MSSTLHITYKPRHDATAESEAAALAPVYSYIFECHAKKKAAGAASTGNKNAKGSLKHEVRVTHIIRD